MRPLAAVAQQLMDPNVTTAELKDVKNVAIVSIECRVPATGVRSGDLVDVYVSAIGASRSLEHGRLFIIPLTGPLPGSPVYAYASGPITIENPDAPTQGVIKGGAQITRDIRTKLLNERGQITLVLNDNIASWPTASTLAGLVNDVTNPDGAPVARAVDQKNIVIDVPVDEQRDPANFVTVILRPYIDPAQIGTGARVVVNERTGTIIVSGDVQISPVIISHKGLTISTITPAPVPNSVNPLVEQNNFVGLDPEKRGGAKLSDLLAAFNQLKVEAADRIAILKEIHKSGKLHAQWIEE
jgi:flagellar P-ring protein precursor FlgI